jgi:hypothetical protein
MKKIFLAIVIIASLAAATLFPAGSIFVDNDNGGIAKIEIAYYDVKPENPGKPQPSPTPDAVGYSLMGVKWSTERLPVDYVVNPANPYGLTDGTVIGNVVASAETWDDATGANLFVDIPAGQDLSSFKDETAVYGSFDNKNAITFGRLQKRTIGVTSVWYNPQTLEILEFDMKLNTLYNWGDAGIDPAVMDLQNILTHELGHSVGMGDIYSTAYSDVTMYGYSDIGDTGKRILDDWDITGLRVIYGQ